MVSYLGISYLIRYNEILCMNVKKFNSFSVNFYQLGQISKTVTLQGYSTYLLKENYNYLPVSL